MINFINGLIKYIFNERTINAIIQFIIRENDGNDFYYDMNMANNDSNKKLLIKNNLIEYLIYFILNKFSYNRFKLSFQKPRNLLLINIF